MPEKSENPWGCGTWALLIFGTYAGSYILLIIADLIFGLRPPHAVDEVLEVVYTPVGIVLAILIELLTFPFR